MGVSPEASAEEIRAAFERLSLQLNQEGVQPEELWTEIEEAYVVLSDPQSRAEYNRLYKIFGELSKGFDGLDPIRGDQGGALRGLKTEIRDSFKPEWEEMTDLDLDLDLDELDDPVLGDLAQVLKSAIFNLINRQNGRSFLRVGPRHHLADTDVYVDLTLNHGEAGYKYLDYHGYIQCSDCGGGGSRRDLPLIDCPACLNLKDKRRCLVCAGLGRYPKENCSRCKGEGRVMVKRQVEIKIPENIQHQAVIQVADEGHQGFRGLKKGDLFVKVLLAGKEKNVDE